MKKVQSIFTLLVSVAIVWAIMASVGLAAEVTNVSSTADDDIYTAGDVIEITVTFDEQVVITGTPVTVTVGGRVVVSNIPKLKLETGSGDQYAYYTSGSNSDTLTFSYTVQDGDTASDLDYTNQNALTLNGGTIKKVSGGPANLKLPQPGEAGSLSFNKDIIISESGLGVNLSYSVNPASVGNLVIIATYPKIVKSGQIPLISIDQSGTVDIVNAPMTQGNNRKTWTYTYIVHQENNAAYIDGTATVTLSPVTDNPGNVFTNVFNNTFDINTSDSISSCFTSIAHNQVIGSQEVKDPYTLVKRAYTLAEYRAVRYSNLFRNNNNLTYRVRFNITQHFADSMDDLQVIFRLNDYNEPGVRLTMNQMRLYKVGTGYIKDLGFTKTGKNIYRVNIGQVPISTKCAIAEYGAGEYYIEYNCTLTIGINLEDINQTTIIIKNNCIFKTGIIGLNGKVIEPNRPTHKTSIDTRALRSSAIVQ